MAEAKARRLERIHRVRTLQLRQVQAEEADAHARLAQEAAMRERISMLSGNVAPTPAPLPVAATSLAAAAHFRERLHRTAEAADKRLAQAEQGLDAARSATREAKRDQTAVEKLISREEADAALRALRELEALPPMRKKRHGPC
ncbi:hypothetical protein [Stakelama tenebrarum]|uniref:Flagellar FliJ protein n=1 Tax=Stakelama tenebrarum TaxID=2711215 RepID=A0A6G6Y1A6_9SPHN|nr:hypothetical protein [Sphingosinithalassobacter tenebrarum]QIG78724.1 hypothetical protein G5C33_02245 [Sphingosinithalassobacter tenebrarum]